MWENLNSSLREVNSNSTNRDFFFKLCDFGLSHSKCGGACVLTLPRCCTCLDTLLVACGTVKDCCLTILTAAQIMKRKSQHPDAFRQHNLGQKLIEQIISEDC